MVDKSLLRELRVGLEPLGFRYTGINRANHLVWQHPQAGTLVTVARYGSSRTLDNTFTKAKRLLRRCDRVR